MNMLTKFLGGWLLAAIVVGIINLALIGAAVWVVVKVLQYTGVL